MYMLSAFIVFIVFIAGLAASGGLSGGEPNESAAYVVVLGVVLAVTSALSEPETQST